MDTAVESLCRRASWGDADRSSVRALLAPWFAEGWTVDAVLLAVDKRPDGVRQGAPKTRDQVAHDFLRARLRSWWEGGARRARPPVPGMTLGQWWRVNRRNAHLNQPRPRRPLPPAGERAVAASRARVRERLKDPVERARARSRRHQEVLDSLLVPGQRPPTFDDATKLLATLRTPLPLHPVCAHCGCRPVPYPKAA
ncbi:hypothetical protein [Actinosynnema sp. NPDC020468]|uniref:hypothetical protein n=1 Tax=Actinosynnema sp. NPDC020468 TaxID=3154488 RepID=UPI0033D163E2